MTGIFFQNPFCVNMSFCWGTLFGERWEEEKTHISSKTKPKKIVSLVSMRKNIYIYGLKPNAYFRKEVQVMGPPINVDNIVSCESNSWTRKIQALSPIYNAREVRVISSFNNANQIGYSINKSGPWAHFKKLRNVDH